MNTQARKFSRLDYLRLIDEVQDYAIILLDIDGTIRNWNQGANRIKGYEFNEIIGKNFTLFYTKEDILNGKPFELLRNAEKHGRATDEGWRVRKDGTLFWASVTITALHNEDGYVTGFGKVTRDLTDKLVANRIRETEVRTKEIEQFAYVVSHDLQEPIRTVRNYIEVLCEDCLEDLSEDAMKYLDSINRAMERMQQMVIVMLDFSRLGKDKILKEVDLKELVENVRSDLALKLNEKEACFEVDLKGKIKAYETEFSQLILNLLTNALKFQKPDTKPEIMIGMEEKADEYVFHFKDNGIGIAPENQEKVFRVFQKLHRSNQYEGHGIGLANCKKIVDMHLGRIWVESELGKGSTFYFSISSKL